MRHLKNAVYFFCDALCFFYDAMRHQQLDQCLLKEVLKQNPYYYRLLERDLRLYTAIFMSYEDTFKNVPYTFRSSIKQSIVFYKISPYEKGASEMKRIRLYICSQKFLL